MRHLSKASSVRYEPDGSAKFFATAFQNAKIKEAVNRMLNERDGLAQFVPGNTGINTVGFAVLFLHT